MKLAFVIQRYGLEVNGGAEALCRLVAEHLSKYFDIEVITTCAIDYMTWKNEYVPGKTDVNGITTWRFPVDAPRDIKRFNQLSEFVFQNPHTRDDEITWMKFQGPYSTPLLEHIKNNENNYDFFIFFTYLYCTTFFGLPLVKDKAILVPTAHDEPPIYLQIFESVFTQPKAIIFSTEEEKNFIHAKFHNDFITHNVTGVGIDIPETIEPTSFSKKFGIRSDDFIIYVGRVDTSKGCEELIFHFCRFKNEIDSKIKLILLGKTNIPIPVHPDIVPLGYVSELDKFNAIKAAKVLVNSSPFESLSMVLLEAWLCEKAVLVNGNCQVLKQQCIKSNGGLWYTNYEEFKECLMLLLTDDQMRRNLGLHGKQYVMKNYSWDIIESKYIDLLRRISESK
jgi:glycosyltransferase involved in cell wall biosynthesis